ncbi:MAG: FIST N-terminal domain-containing protein [Cyanobacteria bacterium P01_A01_bin.17]
MKWVSALSMRPSLEAALDDVIEQAQKSLEIQADLALLFISTSFTSEYPRLLPLLQERLSVPHIIGCGGDGIIGQASPGLTSEIEEQPAVSLTLASLPGVKLQTFQLMAEDLPDPDSAPDRWVDLMQVDPTDQPHFILLADAATTKVNDLLQGLDYAYPGAVKIGGLTSGPNLSDGSGLFCDDQLYREGAIGVALSGDIKVETIVAQGCRPIGQPYRVTDAERNVVLQVEEQLAPLDLDQLPETGKEQTPLEALQSVVDTLDEEDRALAQHALSVGVVRNEFKQKLEPGDFLIRNLIGVDPRIGAVAIGDRIRSGQRIQFHLRDAEASAEDLEALLEQYLRKQIGDHAAAGVLLFDCLGRGEGFYDQPDFDTELFHRYIKNIPVSGFFCNGEIGPIGGTTFLHGYTAAFGIFSQPSRD